jgi:5'-3' exonuclease
VKALIDADIVAFSCSAYNEQWGWDACVNDMDDMLERIMTTTNSDTYTMFLSGSHNFRYDINPEYKANRKDKIDPKYRQDAKAYLIEVYGAILCDGIEADDALGIAQGEDTVICSIDKDLLQVPGNHYNWRKDIFTVVSELDGLRSFYRQLLTGDRTDNIFGIRGIGDVKSARYIDHLETELEMFQVVQDLYNDDARLLMNGQCLYILQQSKEERWHFPSEQQQP